MPRSGIAGSYGISILSFLRDLRTVLHSDVTSLHPQEQYRWLPFLRAFSSICFADFLMTDVRWYLTVVKHTQFFIEKFKYAWVNKYVT